ncbi:hypothetical protein ACFQ14_06595 [Pseudahrensia aquimaris]|uniref:Uncharacterized protein n=1 Tax=Pseudahrensia aquimaris TaxID=744461 RepID=A0ABW3FER3_9HYPH
MSYIEISSAPKQLSQEEVHDQFCEWMKTKLPCNAGRREFTRGRYMIRVATQETVPAIFDEFKRALAAREVTACLYIFNDYRFADGNSDTASAFKFLAEQMVGISRLPACALAHGAPLTNEVELLCPVTNQLTVFDDFECIAFCPQSNNLHDPLYDPLMATPFTAVNMSSDVYAFSRFVDDKARQSLGHPVHEESDIEKISKLFDTCVSSWHRLATSIIKNYEAITDTRKCPVHVTDDGQYWVAAHKDPAFAEQVKEPHKHELPELYARRITDEWLAWFRDGKAYNAGGLARDGVSL